MDVLLHRYLVCFYCGQRSSRRQDSSSVRKWRCTKCEAVNYLDENGNITDPPVDQANGAEVRYAHIGDRQPSSLEKSISVSSDEALFCATCIKNQHLLNENLSTYLPSTEHPDYATYEVSYPAYRKNLEARYPQVCRDCEAQVRERIRSAGYVAKTDHLRRMLQSSRSTDIGRTSRGCGWQGILVSLGGLAWWASVMGQSLWHGYELLFMTAFDDDETGSGRRHDSLRRLQPGARPALDAETRDLIGSMAFWALFLAFSTFWWNGKLMGRLRRSDTRLTHLNEFYRLQALILLVRSLAWWGLKKDSRLALEAPALRGAHALALLFIGSSTFISVRTVGLTLYPPVSFHGPDKPLVQGPLATDGKGRGRPNGFSMPTQPRPFPVDKLAPQVPSAPANEPGYRPLTPPPVDDADMMDWSPVRTPFNPLRPAVTSASQRRPTAPDAALKRSQGPRAVAPSSRLTGNTQPSLLDRRDRAGAFPPMKREEMILAPQRLFLPEDNDTATSLERLFNSVFSISDEPAEVHAAKEEHRLEERAHTEATAGMGRLRTTFLALLSTAAIYVWRYSIYQFGSGTRYFRHAGLWLGVIVTSLSTLSAVARGRALSLEAASDAIQAIACLSVIGVVDRFTTIRSDSIRPWGTILLVCILARRMAVCLQSWQTPTTLVVRPERQQDPPKQRNSSPAACTSTRDRTDILPNQSISSRLEPSTSIFQSVVRRPDAQSRQNLPYRSSSPVHSSSSSASRSAKPRAALGSSSTSTSIGDSLPHLSINSPFTSPRSSASNPAFHQRRS